MQLLYHTDSTNYLPELTAAMFQVSWYMNLTPADKLRNQYKKICFSPHNVYWGCVPPVCVLDGSTKTSSSSALLKKKKHTSKQLSSVQFGSQTSYYSINSASPVNTVYSLCPT